MATDGQRWGIKNAGVERWSLYLTIVFVVIVVSIL